MQKKILFLCTGNSSRSQMAEGFGKKYLSKHNISSAGTEACGINPNAITSMKKIGVDISKQTSQKIDLNNLNNYDLIITLCSDAKDKCPLLINNLKHIHWNLDDPAKLTGSEEKILLGFSNVRDKILTNIKKMNI